MLSYTRIMTWEICIDGSIKVLCNRYGDEDASDCTGMDFQFTNRVCKVDDATMEVINMKKEESGVTGCYLGSLPTRRIYQNNVLLIGNLI